jgi:hypothetical protein
MSATSRKHHGECPRGVRQPFLRCMPIKKTVPIQRLRRSKKRSAPWIGDVSADHETTTRLPICFGKRFGLRINVDGLFSSLQTAVDDPSRSEYLTTFLKVSQELASIARVRSRYLTRLVIETPSMSRVRSTLRVNLRWPPSSSHDRGTLLPRVAPLGLKAPACGTPPIFVCARS